MTKSEKLPIPPRRDRNELEETPATRSAQSVQRTSFRTATKTRWASSNEIVFGFDQNMGVLRPTLRLTDPAPLVLDLKPRRPRRVRWSRLVERSRCAAGQNNTGWHWA